MNARNSNQQKYSNAGEQAGRVIGEFMSIADELSKRFEKGFSETSRTCDASAQNDKQTADSASPTNSASYATVGEDQLHNGFDGDRDLENEWRQAGEYLCELRKAAGYTVDGLAKAINSQGAARKINSVEEGRDRFPEDWPEDWREDLLERRLGIELIMTEYFVFFN